MNSLLPFLPPLFGAIVGFVIKWIYDYTSQRLKFKKELEDNDHIDVTGDWFAAWQTSVDDAPLINTEQLRLEQKGKTLRLWNTEKSPENPKAGYLWQGQMQFLQGRNVMGWYLPRKEEHNASKGIVYLTYLSPRKQFIGKWIGSAFDGELVTGYVVISKVRAEARKYLEEFIAKHPQDLKLIGYSGIK